jgi:hypothetical protein
LPYTCKASVLIETETDGESLPMMMTRINRKHALRAATPATIWLSSVGMPKAIRLSGCSESLPVSYLGLGFMQVSQNTTGQETIVDRQLKT